MSVKSPKEIEVANCISARTDRGISNRKSEGSGVLEVKTCVLKNMIDKKKEPTLDFQDVGVTILARNYKGLNNYGSNGVLEWKLD